MHHSFAWCVFILLKRSFSPGRTGGFHQLLDKKSRHERYKVRDDVVEMTGPDKASLVSLFFNYMSVLLRKTWTMQVQVLSKFHSKIKRPSMTVF